jgi:hypothetical protein
VFLHKFDSVLCAEGERETHTQIETDRQTETERDRQSETGRQTETERHRETQRDTERGKRNSLSSFLVSPGFCSHRERRKPCSIEYI